jgi:hypothetical protein
MVIYLTKGICKECGSIIEQKEYLVEFSLCRKCYNEYRRKKSYESYHINKLPFQLRMKRYYLKNRKQILLENMLKTLKLKATVLSHYTISGFPQCSNPFGIHKTPYTDIRALSIDHIHGGGNKHKKVAGSGSLLYRWLKRNNYPPGYQVLCMNCQFIKSVVEHEN